MSSARHSGPGYPRGGLHGQIVHAIGRQILSGQIRPGDLLPAQPGLPASRTVLREAIKVLAAKGLVESRPKTGTRVRPRNALNLLDPDVMAWHQHGPRPAAFLLKLTEVRMIVEPAAPSWPPSGARGRPSNPRRGLPGRWKRRCADGSQTTRPSDQADMRFHQAIVRGLRERLLEQMSDVVVSALLVSFHATSRLPGREKASLRRRSIAPS
jgi:DNA-binding FadR family transcriptional regulator